MSAFIHGDLEENLNANGKTHLLVVGFNASACVFETIQDALTLNFKVAMLEDGIGEDGGNHAQIGDNLHALKELGAIRTDSETALKHLPQ